jgi:hypothetical protein
MMLTMTTQKDIELVGREIAKNKNLTADLQYDFKNFQEKILE